MSDSPLVGPRSAPDLHVLTLNVRRRVPHRRTDHPDAWTHRRGAVLELLGSESPHLAALQEVLPDQERWLTDRLQPRWTAVLRDRGRRGDGERVGMLVDTDRLRVTGEHVRALSRRPERIGSRSWGTLFPRIAVGLRLEDRVTGTRFLAVSVHLDVASPLARRRSAELLVRWADEAELPVVVLGDANAPADSAPHRVLTDAGFADTWTAAASHASEQWGTHLGYRAPRQGGRRIDWILARGSDGVRASVVAAAVSTRRPSGVWPSDHAAVQAVLRWEAA
ncbi:endonuclease/exonuclease/phosphatase family protein [Curtobacterium sp. SORGH_AS_0776]|uniref:endonuclease/exonuclease/phosphatase family protein n=1 Tax=Curtobacterium sp. SORGH_AS_0776 TaxID=3041798 RepID=UPI002856CC7B|nr:endonuclease/exonuclease/phosphatase family protein [Curtobacterium sp. SORGH_AS_0776]MDR6170502.1 endonuclease/exonuclease/phosphatase family metal-dependent hydrolase [Curtobacterium sp. SORGH_AS_0776]